MPRLSEVTGTNRRKLSEVQAAEPPAARAANPPPSATPALPQPSLFGLSSDFKERSGLSAFEMLAGAGKDMFGSRMGAAEYLAGKSGGRALLGSDDSPLVQLQDGTQYRLNNPGLDSTDVGNVAGNVAALWSPASWINRFNQTKGLGLLGRMGTQGGGLAAADSGLQALFNRGQVDPIRTGATALGGGLGELVGPLVARGADAIRRGLTSGQTRQEAAQALAREIGLQNPNAEQLARLGGAADEIAAGTDPRTVLGREEFGFIYTQGQRAKDPVRARELLTREEGLRQSPGGSPAFELAGRRNADSLTTALDSFRSKWGATADTPAGLAQDAAERVSGQANDLRGRIGTAYDNAATGTRAAIDAASIRALPDRLAQSVRDFAPNATTTPATARTLEQLQNQTSMILKGGEGANVRGVTLNALETQRRILGHNLDAAANKADRTAMGALKREFDGWLDEAVDSALVSGDPAALEALKNARGLRAEYGRRFEGGADSDKFIAGLLNGSKTPEELVNIALGASSVSKAGGARFIERLRVAAANDPAVMGNLRTAHFMRLTRDGSGKPLEAGRIVRNIAATDYGNASVVHALYSPKEWAEVQRLATALEPLVLKGDLARTSGTTERLLRQLYQKVGGQLPFIGNSLRGIGDTVDSVQAGKLVNSPLLPQYRADPSLNATTAAGFGDWQR